MPSVLLPAAAAAAVPVAGWILLRPARWVHAFLLAAVLLPPLPVPLGNSGPHPALLFAGLGVLAGLIYLPAWRIEPTFLAGALATFPLILLGSVSLAAFYSGAAIAAGSLARVLLFGISVYVFFYTAYGPGAVDAADDWRALRVMYAAGVLSAAFACVDFFFQLPAPAGFGPQFVWLDSGVYRRAQGLFYEASTLGNYCVFFLVMIAVAVVRSPRHLRVPRWILLAGGVVFATALVFSYSRASLVSLVFAVATLLLLNRSRMRFGRPALVIGVGAVVAGFVAYRMLPDLAEAWWLRLRSSVEYMSAAPELVLSGRLAAWETLAQFAAAHPWRLLFGIGYKTLPYTALLGTPVVADNMYLSILVETGAAGLAAMLLCSFAILHAAYTAAKQPDARTAFFGAWLFCFWVGQMAQMMSGDLLTYWRVLPLYFWTLALLVRGARSEHPLH
jgi:O-antigen ligase